jgi:hypothetical protein
MAKTKTPEALISTDALFAASAMAARINNRVYHKTTLIIESGTTQYANRLLVEMALGGELEITEADVEAGSAMRLFFQGLMFKLLSGAKMTDFEKKVIGIATRDESTKSDIAIAASLPLVYDKMQERKERDNRLDDCTPGFISNVGNKVALDIEVVKSYWLDSDGRQYDGYSVTAITGDNYRVGFISQKQFRVGQRVSITAKVKSHFQPSNTTYLFYVKEVLVK